MGIKVFTKSNCMQCIFTKQWLDDKGIEYQAIDCQEDESQLDYLRSLGFQSLPVIEIDGHKPFFGFRPDKMEMIIGETS